MGNRQLGNRSSNVNKKAREIRRTNAWDGDTYVYFGGKVNEQERENIVHVVVPSTVTRIEEKAFLNCRSLTTVICLSSSSSSSKSSSSSSKSTTDDISTKAPASLLREIGSHAFYRCDSLTSIILPSSVIKIEEQAFFGCRNLISIGPTGSSSLSLPESLRIVEDEAFNKCIRLSGIEFPNSIQRLGGCCFVGCTGLKFVKFSKNSTGLDQIGGGSFAGCKNLKTIEISGYTKIIGNSSFRDCTELSSVSLPESIEEIKMYSFANCKSLNHITIPSNIRKIEGGAFRGSGLTSIEIPDTIQTIRYQTFAYCQNLQCVRLGLFTKVLDNGAFESCTSLTSINLPNTIERIGNKVFLCNSNLRTIIFSSTQNINGQHHHRPLKRIGHAAFANCNALERMKIPDRLERVGHAAFTGCPGLSITVKLSEDEEICLADTDSVHFVCDLNCGGRKFLKRSDDDNDEENYNDESNRGDTKENSDKSKSNKNRYLSSLWPLILDRSLNRMDFPTYTIFGGANKKDNDSTVYTNAEPIRRASIVYYLMLHGVAMEYH